MFTDGLACGYQGEMYKALNAKGDPFPIAMTPALQRLDKAEKLDIRQLHVDEDIFSCNFCDCRRKHDVRGEDGEVIFASRETTALCLRAGQRILPDVFPWEISIDYLGVDDPQPEQLFLTKGCSPTCLCINRRIVQIHDDNGVLLGSLRDPCVLCPRNLSYTINDEDGDVLLRAESGPRLQWAFCCPMAFGPCHDGELVITDNDKKEVGRLKKRINGWMRCICCSCCVDNFNRVDHLFVVDMSGVKCARTRALVMALALFTDFRYWGGADEEYNTCF